MRAKPAGLKLISRKVKQDRVGQLYNQHKNDIRTYGHTIYL